MDPFNISGIDGRREFEQRKGGLEVTAVITYKTSFVVNVKLVTVSLTLGEGVACNTIFSWPFWQTIKASLTKNNYLLIALLREQFRLEIIIPQKFKEAPKTSEGLPVSLTVTIQGKQENMKDIGSSNIMVELKKTVIHQRHISGQN